MVRPVSFCQKLTGQIRELENALRQTKRVIGEKTATFSQIRRSLVCLSLTRHLHLRNWNRLTVSKKSIKPSGLQMH